MKTLLILRHGKSSWKEAGLADHERPLKGRGERDAVEVGRRLAELGLVPELVVSSTARRARATAMLAARASGCSQEVVPARELYAASAQAVICVISTVPAGSERVMVVGHNPGLEEVLEVLTGEARRLPTACVACVELPVDTWLEVQPGVVGRLLWTWRPGDQGGEAEVR